jgi:hypothetical protein
MRLLVSRKKFASAITDCPASSERRTNRKMSR